MNIYHIARHDHIGYDEYAEEVIIAKDEAAAFALSNIGGPCKDVTIDLIGATIPGGDAEPRVVCVDFRAG